MSDCRMSPASDAELSCLSCMGWWRRKSAPGRLSLFAWALEALGELLLALLSPSSDDDEAEMVRLRVERWVWAAVLVRGLGVGLAETE